MDPGHYAQAIAPFDAEVARLRPDGAEVLDAHTHLGLDEDGRSLSPEALLGQLDAAGARRACVFALHDPERDPAYRVPNDRVLAWSAASDGRLIPFCRLDPADGPLAEGERALAAGARGIKLHPRAQVFAFDGPAIEGIFTLAEQARVPILIHAGRGMPPIADGLADVALRHPEVVIILAHTAIADQGILTTRLADHPGVLYDVSTWSAFDVMELFARVAPQRVVFASDPPYGRPAATLYMALRVAVAIGLDDQALRLFLGGTMAQLIDGHGLPAPGPPCGPGRITVTHRQMRIYSYLMMAGPALFAAQLELARGAIELAAAACRDPRPEPHQAMLSDVGAALGAALSLLDGPAETIPDVLDLVYRCLARAATETI